MNDLSTRKPIFDAARRIVGHGLSQAEVNALDAAIDRAEAQPRPDAGPLLPATACPAPHRLGTLSERYESGGCGPGTVSGGVGDPGGVSYGLFQLASRTGTAARFLAAEGKRWAARFGSSLPGSAEFSATWQDIAAHEGETFAEAQRLFVARSHYRPAVLAVQVATGLDLDARADAVRDAVWSTAVQHGSAARLLCAAVAEADQSGPRTDAAYDRALIEAIYRQRSDYVSALAQRSGPAVRRTLMNVAQRRYPDELAVALAMLPTLA
ncbi:MAG: hypothetical protein ABI673_05725 [Novosphingobium sp.]